MTKTDHNIPVVIIGGGPVGLFLAISLLNKGIDCKVIEKRSGPVPDSRSLGIHPVSLELFDELGITEPFLKSGLKIKKGLALTENKMLGEISFEHCPKPHNYILACPQFITEKILRDELKKLDETALITEAEFLGYQEADNSIVVKYSNQENQTYQISASWLIGCDGKNSPVRKQASIHYSGKRYDDTYIMGDFEDTTEFRNDAAVFLPKGGLIECFPLPDGMRRWVVKTDSYIPEPNQDKLAGLVNKRIGYDLSSVKSTMLSSFGVQHFMAETFARGRVVLAGDAAHVVSPIGGQGMNLGWLDCRYIADLFSDSGTGKDLHDLSPYSQKQRKVAQQIARRAEINMALGRKQYFPAIRNLFIRGILGSSLRNKVAELFTMRGLGRWWI
jgi:2-polyprenyl-6-methoxyphenol hydroxylase-like FAD-dependent oxidoreductase